MDVYEIIRNIKAAERSLTDDNVRNSLPEVNYLETNKKQINCART